METAVRRLITAVIAVLLVAVPARAAELLMFDEAGCVWCEKWEEEIGPVYPRTEESIVAPLRRLSIHDPLPAGIALDARVRYTPTFVLIHGGREVGRFEGYPGEDFFWPMLGRLIDRLPASKPRFSRPPGIN